MATEVKLPELGENLEGGEVLEVRVAAGDTVQEGQTLLEVEAEKSTVEVPSPLAGRVEKVQVKKGDQVKVGQPLCQIDADGKQAEKQAAEAATKAAPKEVEKENGGAREESAAAEEHGRSKPAAAREKGARANEETLSEPETKKESKQAAAKVAKSDEEKEEQEQGNGQHQAADTDTQRGTGDDGQQAPVNEAVVPAGPATRRLARELGVDLHHVHGTGPGGRVTPDDVKAHVRESNEARLPLGPTSNAPPLPDFERYGPVERQPLDAVRRRTAEQMSLAWSVIPHVTQHDQADVSEIDTFIKQENAAIQASSEMRRAKSEERSDAASGGRQPAEGGKNIEHRTSNVERRTEQASGGRQPVEEHGGKQSPPKLTVTAFALKAAALTLRQFPQFNASLDVAAGQLIVKQYVHIGVAVDTERGLLVPVLRDVDQKGVRELATELAELAELARQKKLAVEQMRGGTFTISNLGGIGGTAFTPIVNWPEVAILGMSRARLQPTVRDGAVVPRLLLPLSLSYDHRVIDGASAARFTRRLAELLENPLRMLL